MAGLGDSVEQSAFATSEQVQEAETWRYQVERLTAELDDLMA